MITRSEKYKKHLREEEASKKMSILFVIDGYYPCFSGAEKQAELLINALFSQGYNVKVIAPYMDKTLPRTEIIKGVFVERIAYPRVKILGAIILVTKVAFKLINERKSFDAIHIHMVKNLAAVIGLVKPWLRATVIAKISGAWEFEGGVLDPKLASKPLNRIMNIFIKRIDYFQAISKFTVEQLKLAGYPSKKILFIPNAINTEKFTVSRSKELPDSINVVYTGRLEFVKGVDVLLEAWGKTLASVGEQKIKLIIAGTGNEQLKLNEIVDKYKMNESVDFLGVVDDVPKVLSVADIYIQPSRQEGLSNSVLEAMSTGLPIVATRVSGNEDIISHNNNGFLVASENPVELADSIVQLINNEEQRIKFGDKSHEIIMGGYQLPVILKKLIIAYNKEV